MEIEGAKGTDGNWIDPAIIDKFGLKRRPHANMQRFVSRLFPGQQYVPTEEVDVKLVFEPAGIAICVKCLVLPDSTVAHQSEVIIGDADIEFYGVRDLIRAKSPLFKPAREATEVLSSLGNKLKEQELLENFGSFVKKKKNRVELTCGILSYVQRIFQLKVGGVSVC